MLPGRGSPKAAAGFADHGHGIEDSWMLPGDGAPPGPDADEDEDEDRPQPQVEPVTPVGRVKSQVIVKPYMAEEEDEEEHHHHHQVEPVTPPARGRPRPLGHRQVTAEGSLLAPPVEEKKMRMVLQLPPRAVDVRLGTDLHPEATDQPTPRMQQERPAGKAVVIDVEMEGDGPRRRGDARHDEAKAALKKATKDEKKEGKTKAGGTKLTGGKGTKPTKGTKPEKKAEDGVGLKASTHGGAPAKPAGKPAKAAKAGQEPLPGHGKLKATTGR